MTARNNCAINRLTAWIPALLWMGVIYLLSDQPHSGELTERYLGDWNIPIRKLAHMSEYAILFCLFRRALMAGKPAPDRMPTKPSALAPGPGPIALLLCVLYAASDELHQAYVPGRSATISDGLWDCAGAAMAWAAWLLNTVIRALSTRSRAT